MLDNVLMEVNSIAFLKARSILDLPMGSVCVCNGTIREGDNVFKVLPFSVPIPKVMPSSSLSTLSLVL